MIVLSIESSCDETAAALVQDGRKILSSVVASQIAVHAEYGGVVPELASREHVDNISYVLPACMKRAADNGFPVQWKDVGAIAATRGPGLVGALLVGLSYAKALAFALKVPFLGVNHLQGHIHSIFLDHPEAQLPALSLVVSGGHTSIFHFTGPGSFEEIAQTRDDAAGEALDKLSKHLGLGYPGGPVIDRLAPRGDPAAVPFALPKMNQNPLDFSFSGLKTAAVRYVQAHQLQLSGPEAVKDPESIPQPVLDLIASYQKSIVDQLLDRLDRAREGREVRSIQISGGVSCNSELRRRSKEFFAERALPVYYPRPALTTDNAAMIAAAAFFRLQKGESDSWDLSADPNLRATA